MNPKLWAYTYLAVAILAEIVATSALAASNGFTNLKPSIVTVFGYSIAFFLLSLALREIPTGIAYAIWSGVGIVLIAAVSWIWLKQALDVPAIIGLALIVAGVVVVNVFSKVAHH